MHYCFQNIFFIRITNKMYVFEFEIFFLQFSLEALAIRGFIVAYSQPFGLVYG
jgi:hypothetical protein